MNDYPKDPLKLYDMGLELVKKDPKAIAEIKRLKALSAKNILAMDKSEFLEEYAWVVYVSGFKEAVIDDKWDVIAEDFNGFEPENIDEKCIEQVIDHFANKRKAEAIVKTAHLLRKMPWDEFISSFLKTPEHMQRLPFVGEVTCYHLSRNIGMQYAKPDRHLLRFSRHCGYGDNVQDFCKYIADNKNEVISCVDFVLWNLGKEKGTDCLTRYDEPYIKNNSKPNYKKSEGAKMTYKNKNVPWTVITNDKAGRSYPYSSIAINDAKEIELCESFSADLEEMYIDNQKTFIRLAMVLSKEFSHKCTKNDFRFEHDGHPFIYIEIESDCIGVSVKVERITFTDPDNRFDDYPGGFKYKWVDTEENAELVAKYIIKNVRS